MNIQWFPGHMAKTKKLIAGNLRMIDIVIEILDARIPYSSRNPEIDTLLKSKPKIIVLNKVDLADDQVSVRWSKWYDNSGYPNVLVDSIRGKGTQDLIQKLKEMMKDKFDKEKQKGKIYRPVRTMMLGIPNVGKSSLINRIAAGARTAVEDKPGVTRKEQWIRLEKGIEMLDMPGILWPKLQDRGIENIKGRKDYKDYKDIGINLAITGAIRDDILDIVEIASRLMEILSKTYPGFLKSRYKIEFPKDYTGYALLEEAGKKRGCLVSGGNVDLNRIAAVVLDEFRGGKIGKISLETPPS